MNKFKYIEMNLNIGPASKTAAPLIQSLTEFVQNNIERFGETKELSINEILAPITFQEENDSLKVTISITGSLINKVSKIPNAENEDPKGDFIDQCGVGKLVDLLETIDADGTIPDYETEVSIFNDRAGECMGSADFITGITITVPVSEIDNLIELL
ncbi:hypothetical protein ACFL57_01255 [Candidatus Margulisiibacteriota bacterium]